MVLVHDAGTARICRDFVNNPAKILPHSVFSSTIPHGACGLSSSNSVRVNRGWAWYLKLSIILGAKTMPQFDAELVHLMRTALEEIMTRVPVEYSTPAIKAYLAECILKAAAQGQTSYDGLLAAAVDQIQSALSLFV